MVIFISRKTPTSSGPIPFTGHAFVMWQHIAPGQPPQLVAYGLYPQNANPSALLGPVPGSVRDEVLRVRMSPADPPLPPTDILAVMVDKSQYDASLAIESRFPQNPTYVAGIQDCVTFTDTIAKSLMLTTPDRSSALLPNTYLEKLIQSVEAPATEPFDGGTYTGPVYAGKPNGNGRIQFDDGRVFQGVTHRGFVIDGTLTYKDGDEWDGGLDFNGLPQGNGIYKYANGAKGYFGTMKSGSYHGRGQEIVYHPGSSDDIYDGDWNAGILKVGKARIGTTEYRGQFDSARNFVFGEMVQNDRTSFFGHFTNGTLEGVGREVNGQGTYVGDFHDNLYDGRGVLTRSDGLVMDGTWRAGVATGDFNLKYPDGTTYSGHLVNGSADGNGQRVMTNGVYTGHFSAGLEDGYGELKQSDGHDFTGNWTGGVLHGQVTVRYPDGRVYRGAWNSNHPEGQGTMTNADGSGYSGEYNINGDPAAGNFFDSYKHVYEVMKPGGKVYSADAQTTSGFQFPPTPPPWHPPPLPTMPRAPTLPTYPTVSLPPISGSGVEPTPDPGDQVPVDNTPPG